MAEPVAAGAAEEWCWRSATYGTANWFRFENAGGGAGDDILLSFNPLDLAAGIGITLASGDIFEAPIEIARFWTLSTAGSTFTALAAQRRGG